MFEYAHDRYVSGYESLPGSDPISEGSGGFRTLRGGSFRSQASECRAAARFTHIDLDRRSNLGFRLARSAR